MALLRTDQSRRNSPALPVHVPRPWQPRMAFDHLCPSRTVYGLRYLSVKQSWPVLGCDASRSLVDSRARGWEEVGMTSVRPFLAISTSHLSLALNIWTFLGFAYFG